MAQRVIFPTSSGISVLIPVGSLSISEIARKDVPAGVAYRIVDESEIPADRSQRALWTADFSSPDGYGIGADAWFAAQEGTQ